MYEFLVTKDTKGLTRPVQDVFREVLYHLWMRPCDPPPPVVDAAEEDEPAPQQTATPSPDPSRSQFIDDLLNRAFVANKLKLAQRREDREQTVLASKEPLGTTALKESSITNASSLLQPTLREDGEPNVFSKGLLGTTTLEESSITKASSLLQPTPREDREPNVLASKELLDTTTLESITNTSSPPQPTPFQSGMLSSKDASSTRAEEVTHSLTPPILARKPAGWNHQFFIRVDLGGSFHTYPELGGPFRSLEEAKKAILCRLDKLRDPKMSTNDGLSSSEIAIRDALHWPDGTRKYSSRSNPDEDHMGLLVQALLDKYNEENNLLEDDAYHVEKVVSFQEVYEGKGGWYYHLNCTRKTKGGVDNLFFAEVLRMNRGLQFELTCLHMVEPAVDNGTCYGCKKPNVGMKHPIDAGKYKGGHDPSWPQRPCVVLPPDLPEGFDAKMKAMEERIRYQFQDSDVLIPDAGKTAAADGLDKSQLGRRGFPAADARMNKERIRYVYGDRDVAKPDAGRPAAGLKGKWGKYVIPSMRLKV